jgi:hypothetical protein
VSAALEKAKANIAQMDLLLAALGNTPARMLRRRATLIRRIDVLQEQNAELFRQELGPQHERLDAVAALPPSAGHQLAREQIAGHGMDRYPDVPAQLLKLMAELGELAEELAGRHRPMEGLAERIRREYADVGLSYYELGNKLHLDAVECMTAVVSGDERHFSDDSERP